MTNVAIKKTELFFSKYPSVIFKKGEIIFLPEQPIIDIFYLKSGSVRMYAISEHGEEVTLHIFRPNSFFPIMLLLSNTPNVYYFESLENSETFKARAVDVMKFLRAEPELLYDLVVRFASAVNGLLVRIETLAGENALTKLVRLLLYLADKFGKKDGTKTIIWLPITHEDVARWIGLRRETVSRQLEKLQRQNLLYFEKKKLILIDLEKIRLLLNKKPLSKEDTDV